jgi:hypothetical protein
MSIHEHLPAQARRELKEVGWTKGVKLAKVAGRDRERFDCNLVAQSPADAERRLQAGGGKGVDRAGNLGVGDYIFQALQEREPGCRAGT